MHNVDPSIRTKPPTYLFSHQIFKEPTRDKIKRSSPMSLALPARLIFSLSPSVGPSAVPPSKASFASVRGYLRTHGRLRKRENREKSEIFALADSGCSAGDGGVAQRAHPEATARAAFRPSLHGRDGRRGGSPPPPTRKA
jgi:hypothetical protein